MSDTFGRRIRAYRKLKCWTQEELAKELGVSLTIVGSLERGTRQPSQEMIHKLGNVLDVTEEELLSDKMSLSPIKDNR
ncbi:helix-turn-helix transcriptional regulator [Alicyclobacillus tolerans]|uniref:DNA-binding transcriptional regulator, XRE-family HTH domain n=2 Tax=Alicyclobacillus tolerans TaxID=90970 RepID=A0A1M6PDX7_9BACL|nr:MULTISPECIES: helix-turn-helix transcriptional regulator [Alicyclobacillus]MDP9729774.1 transcriptional regulator with XRE-family HTH domain [Alicyclobacillus tengchongensis]QRF22375.1 helix-turn-helix transcriptional regulator [Alicyclobacillus sp. TC]SHK06163.1 DNA-binding transcriptional regulator, XRE-family HTH domain [Alicyclobacillus montanus]